MTTLPRRLDEEMARLHLDALGVRLTRLPPAGRLPGRGRRRALHARPLPLLTAAWRTCTLWWWVTDDPR